jgi:hypothetical protein
MSALPKPAMLCSPTDDRSEEGKVGGAEGLKRATRHPRVELGPAQGVEGGDTFAFDNYEK